MNGGCSAITAAILPRWLGQPDMRHSLEHLALVSAANAIAFSSYTDLSDSITTRGTVIFSNYLELSPAML